MRSRVAKVSPDALAGFSGRALVASLGVLLVLGTSILLNGCVDRVDPEYSSLELEGREIGGLPQLILVRRVVPVHTTKTVGAWVGSQQAEEVSSSRFGGVGKVANPKCLIDGLLKSVPNATIVPTSAFWDHVAAPEETIELSRVVAQPILARLQALHVDVLVAGYHQLIDVESFFSELIMAGGVSHKVREVAAVAVIDMETNKLVYVTRGHYVDTDIVGHMFFVVPMGRFTVPSSQPCEATGEQAGAAIRTASVKSKPHILVLATQSDPYEAAARMGDLDQAETIQSQ